MNAMERNKKELTNPANVEPEFCELNPKYVYHEITRTMFLNNMDFYDDVLRKGFDIRLFELSFKKQKWCPLQVIGFLAFGRMFKDVDVTGLLAK